MPDADRPNTLPSVARPREPATLARTMGLWALVIYGVGDMLGSGIYALIGRAAGVMGNAVWVAFLASLAAAVLTGLSYASLGSRYPRAAGAAYIAHRAFRSPFLTYVLGLGVVASGLTSFATQSHAFARYFLPLTGIPAAWVPGIVLAFILLLTGINFWGMRESTYANAICTAVEVGGLLLIVGIAIPHWGSVDYLAMPAATEAAPGGLSMHLVLQGAVLTFYSFVGFEDMINVSEEVKNPRRTFPLAVVLALGITTLIYLAVSISAVSVVPAAELAVSGEPLVEVVRRAAPAFPTGVFSVIALFAIVNTGLLNYIMGSRVVYGLARQGVVPRVLGRVHPVRRTPHLAILVLMVITVALAFSGDIAQLASATSAVLLGAFIVVNASLIILKLRPGEPPGAFEIPVVIPAAGILVCGLMLVHATPRALIIAGLLLAGVSVLFFVTRPRNVTPEPEDVEPS